MKKYLITAFTPGVDTFEEFEQSLQTFSEKHGAPIEYIQTKENYKKDIQGWDKLDELNNKYLHGEIESDKYDEKRINIEDKYNFNEDTERLLELASRTKYLSRNLRLSTMKLNVNLVDPISGLDSLVARKGNMILGYPRQRFKTVPRSLKHSKTPRGIWCTGTISKPYYKDTKTGIRMEPYHTYGALLVIVEDSGAFHIRQIQANVDGSFYDMKHLYKPDGTITEIEGVSGLVMGDIHVPFLNPKVKEIQKEVMGLLKPKKIYYHDALDCCSISHHIEGKQITKSVIREKYQNFEEELEHTSSVLQDYCNVLPNSEHFLVSSNHHDHLPRWLDEGRYNTDPNNQIIGLELAKQHVMKKLGLCRESVIEYSLKKYFPLENMTFLGRGDTSVCSGIDCSYHGDSGAGGARGNPKTIGLAMNGTTISGHTHSPEIGVFNNFVVGTSSFLVMPYTPLDGFSGWMHSDCVIYPSGTRTHLHYVPKD